MLYYSIFQNKKLCIFHAGGQLTYDEMLDCYQDLRVDSRWQDVETILADLRECVDVDISFDDDAARARMENNAFGNRRVIWLTGESRFLGNMAMAEIEGGSSTVERYQFQNADDLERYLGEEGHEILECLWAQG